jgi:hypothetical protein
MNRDSRSIESDLVKNTMHFKGEERFLQQIHWVCNGYLEKFFGKSMINT